MKDVVKIKKDSFQEELKSELNVFLKDQYKKYPAEDLLKIDLHCHDYNSDVPDELLGRILNVPETWLKTEDLVKTLQNNNVDALTITNHNNARSCFELEKKGFDVLSGAEFSCMVPDFDIGIHVLAYGFNIEQERILNRLRKDIYKFQHYALENEIPTVWAHPLYHYKSKGIPSMDFFNKMALIFERFEVLNGQRNTWQNLLVKFWIESLTPDIIDTLCDSHHINPKNYCSNPYKKSFTGGSDCHMGIFSGQTGTYLYVPNLKEKLKTQKASTLALDAIKKGNMVPYGYHQNLERLTIAFLDYVCQIAMHKKDPGLMRILLHKGNLKDKIVALLVSNSFSELQRHKVTMRFIELFHNCFSGKKPNFAYRLLIPKDYRPVFEEAINISKAKGFSSNKMLESINDSVNSISNKLNDILYKRIDRKINRIGSDNVIQNIKISELIENFELPSDLRTLLGLNNKNADNHNKKMVSLDLGNLLDGLPFPFLASNIILGANFTSARVMYNNRELLNSFSESINKLKHPKKILWLTDTFEDKNGVSVFLQDVHKQIKKRNLPVDILVCSDTLKPDKNLVVVKPLSKFVLPNYENQSIRIPDFIEIHNLFLQNEYDRIVCSTEGVMGLAALYLKNAYSVKTYFYMHTDWLIYAKKTLKLDNHNVNRVRRFLRAYYNAFDGIFVLNSDHKKWLTSNEMGLNDSKIFMTAHWVDSIFSPQNKTKLEVFGIQNNEKVLLYAGRLSKEKGVSELPAIYKKLKENNSCLRLVIVGSGPAEAELKVKLPDAIFMGWINHNKLPDIYSAADILLLPSKFDTFSCAALEAMSCGLPVVAYNTKGPKDIIQNTVNGYLVSSQTEMIYRIEEYFSDELLQFIMQNNAIKRAWGYQADNILCQFLSDVKIDITPLHEEIRI